MWTLEMTYSSPAHTHWLSMENIELAARRWDVGYEAIGHTQFRNYQRFGKWNIKTYFVLSHRDEQHLNDFAQALLAAL